MLRSLVISFVFILVSSSCNAESPVAKLVISDVGELSVFVKPFEAKSHVLKFCGDYACLMNGAPFFGSDGKKPDEIVDRITVTIKGKPINLEVKGMVNPGLNSNNISERMKLTHYWGDFYKLSGRFSDGAGSYVAQWIVTQDGSIRTHLSDMETAMDIMTIISPQ